MMLFFTTAGVPPPMVHPPPDEAELPAMVELTTVTGRMLWDRIPPAWSPAEFPVMVVLVIEVEPLEFQIPPPEPVTVFPLTVDPVTTRVPSFEMPPPPVAELPEMVESVIVAVPD
jgi:hypothetical protein